MSKILYRMDPFKELPPKSYEVIKADRPLPFQQLLPEYKAAIFRKIPQVSDKYELEEQFARFWLSKNDEKVELVGLPEHLFMFQMPRELMPGHAEYNHTLIIGNDKQLKEGVDPLQLLVSISDKTGVEINKVPDTIIQDFQVVAELGIDIEQLPFFYAQYHFKKTGEIFFKTNLLWIISQVVFVRQQNITGIKVPVTKSSSQVCVPRDSWGQLQNIPSYTRAMITKELPAEEITWTVPSNSPYTEGVRVVDTVAPVQKSYDEKQFVQYLFTKLRPYDSGSGTIPFNIPIESLLASFMFETTGTTPVKGITLDRREFVTKLNSYHAMKYSLWLGGRDNTPALALEYFGSPKHHASSNAAIERGKAYMTTATLVDNNEIIF